MTHRSTPEPDDLARLAERLAAPARVTVLTGAGVSAASGIPTFRGPDGLWRRHRPEQLATPEAFRRDPGLVWEWYDWRRQTIAGCEPNAAHRVLASWSRRLAGFRLVTQNVDGLHEQAGTARVLRLHGSIWEIRCASRCRGGAAWSDRRCPLPEIPPRCPSCGGLARPAVVWFGEPLDEATYADAVAATDCDVFLAVGTSALVQPAASLMPAAKRRGAFTVEINSEPTRSSEALDLLLRGPAEDILRRVVI